MTVVAASPIAGRQSGWDGLDPGSRLVPVSDDLDGLGFDHGPDGLLRTSRRSICGRLTTTR